MALTPDPAPSAISPRSTLLPLAAKCAHPFAAMRVASWYVSDSGRALTLDAFCLNCGVHYVRGFATEPEEPGGTVPGEELGFYPKSS